jgi:sigma54-dependent transcription regulator
MQPVHDVVSRVGPSDANVLITGEPGTGKEVVAQTLYALSERSSRPLITVNAGGLAEGVFESELFGHVKGAFTDAKIDRVGRFELADGGTLFLDEIANVPFNLQSKLLRVLEIGELERVGSSKTKKVNVRVISATNANLDEEVAQNRFRQDLMYRLNTVEIHLPPLRERKEDLPLLANHFLCARPAIPPAPGRVRSGRNARHAGTPVARQRARTESRGGAGRADVAGHADPPVGPGPARGKQRRASHGGHEPGRGGGVPDPQGDGPP